mgnify:CR=1 FL=1
MNVSISGHHISVTEAMDTAVREKLVKVERHSKMPQSGSDFASLRSRNVCPILRR